MKITKKQLKEIIRKGIKSLQKEGVNQRINMMDDLVDMVGSEEKLLEEVFRALSDREAKEIYQWIARHYT